MDWYYNRGNLDHILTLELVVIIVWIFMSSYIFASLILQHTSTQTSSVYLHSSKTMCNPPCEWVLLSHPKEITFCPVTCFVPWLWSGVMYTTSKHHALKVTACVCVCVCVCICVCVWLFKNLFCNGRKTALQCWFLLYKNANQP